MASSALRSSFQTISLFEPTCVDRSVILEGALDHTERTRSAYYSDENSAANLCVTHADLNEKKHS